MTTERAMSAVPPATPQEKADHGTAPAFLPEWMQPHWLIVLTVLTGLFLLIGFLGELMDWLSPRAALPFFLLAYLAGSYDVALHALPDLRRGKLDTDLLMLAAALGAALLGEWAEGAFLLFLFNLGHAGEEYALDRARNAMDALGELMPKRARRKEGDLIVEVPVEALRIDEAAARTLRRLGLKTIGALLDIPRASLARRFRGEVIGENVLLRLDEMMGHRDEPLNPLNPPSSFMAHRALMEPVITSEGLDALLQGLVAGLCRDLQRRAQGATRLLLKLFRSDGSRVSLPAGFSAATHDRAHMLRVLKPKLETVDAGFGIDAMTLEARETAPAVVQQYGFMEEGGSLVLEQLNDRVMNRHETGLVALEEVESHVPERAEKPGRPLTPPAESLLPPQAREGPRNGGLHPSRPLLIFARPEPAAVIASVPDGPPMRFTWRRVTRKVVKSQGPERVAPEWWRLAQGESPRDYYVIEDEQGRRYWLYREGLYGETGAAQPRWFVHGLSA
ncbi:MAG: hypothetical protein KDD73_15705 [Anaerolineales bacterium]|nr:hypothetical protein [Anaerolineales bacterium]